MCCPPLRPPRCTQLPRRRQKPPLKERTSLRAAQSWRSSGGDRAAQPGNMPCSASCHWGLMVHHSFQPSIFCAAFVKSGGNGFMLLHTK